MARSPEAALTAAMQEADAELQNIDRRIRSLEFELDKAQKIRSAVNLTLGGYVIALDAVRRVGEGGV